MPSGRIRLHIARWLVTGPGASVIVAGTLAFAGLGAGALSSGAGDRDQQSPGVGREVPAYPSAHCHADPESNGGITCYLDAGQLSLYPGADCQPDPDGDGHFLCTFEGR